MENMLENLVSKAKEEINMAMTDAMNIESAKNKTECLNAEYHIGKFHAFMDVIKDLSIDKFVEVGTNIKDMSQFILERINRLYR